LLGREFGRGFHGRSGSGPSSFRPDVRSQFFPPRMLPPAGRNRASGRRMA
jgi:hypothetical protein